MNTKILDFIVGLIIILFTCGLVGFGWILRWLIIG